MAVDWGLHLLICAHLMHQPSARDQPSERDHPFETSIPCQRIALNDTKKMLSITWQHSVEKIQWSEIYRFEDLKFRLISVNIQGSGAGMEIPPEAVLQGNHYVYYPHKIIDSLNLTYSPYTADYSVCIHQTCRFLFDWLNQDKPQNLDQNQAYVVEFKLVL